MPGKVRISMKKHVITIARQYGSRGREIGQKLADALGYKYYDRDLISMAAEKSGYNKDVLRAADEKAANSLLYTLALGSSVYAHGVDHINIPLNDKLYIFIKRERARLSSEDVRIIFSQTKMMLFACLFQLILIQECQ